MTVIAADAGRHPVSAQCGMLGVARSTYYSMRFHAEGPKPPDPIERDVAAAHDASYGRYGARKIKTALSRAGITASRAPRTHVCSDLTYVRVGGGWKYVCLLIDLHNREIVGHSAGPRKDVDLVRAAFATLEFPVSDIKVFRTDRGSEFGNAKIDEMLDAFGIKRSPSRRGCPYDNAVDESTNKILKVALARRNSPRGCIRHSDYSLQNVSPPLSKIMREHGIRPSMGSISSPWDNAAMELLMGPVKSGGGERTGLRHA